MFLFKRWIRRVLGLVVGALMAVGWFALLVDPYDTYRLLTLPGVNANKHMATEHSRVVKPYLVEHLRPTGLAMGTSRTEIGIDPGHTGWSEEARPVFNYGLGGARIDEVLRLLKTAQAEQSLKQLLLGLDLVLFNAYLHDLGEESETAQEVDSGLNHHLSALLTLDALVDSIDTLRKQDPVRYPGYLRNGQIDRDFNTYRISRKGHRQTFRRVERHFVENVFSPPPQHRFNLVDSDTGDSRLDYFREIVALARANRMDLKLYISPIHARLCEVMVQGGLWPVFEDWKRGLVAILAEDARSHPGEPPFILWDFSGYNSITTEEVPPQGDREQLMRYYWEGSHFKKETGDLVQDRVFGYVSPGRTLPEDFGVPIDEENIETHLDSIRRQQRIYRQNHDQDVQEIVEIKESLPYLN